MECGPGHRERYAICQDHQGFIVNTNNCKEVVLENCIFLRGGWGGLYIEDLIGVLMYY